MTVHTIDKLSLFEVREASGYLLCVTSSRDEAETQCVFSAGETITEREWQQVAS